MAEAEEGYHFVEWTGAVGTIADVNAASISITVNDNYFITPTSGRVTHASSPPRLTAPQYQKKYKFYVSSEMNTC